jgi:acyl carrier protein
MNDTTTATRVRAILRENLAVDEDRITEGASLIDDLDADSLDVVELVMTLEEEFRVEITDDEADKMLTVRDVTDLVEGKLQARAA